MRSKIAFGIAALAGVSVCAAAAGPAHPLHVAHRYEGSVDVHSTGNSIVVALSQDHSGRVDTIFTATQGQVEPSVSFRSDRASVLLWEGHLIIRTEDLRRALHISVPGFLATVELREKGASTATKIDPRRLDAELSEAYDLTALDSASELISRSAKWNLPVQIDDEATQDEVVRQERAHLRRHASAINTTPYNKDLGDGSGGDGSSSCGDLKCPDGSTCSVSCPAGTGGNPTKVASCVCNPSAHCGCG